MSALGLGRPGRVLHVTDSYLPTVGGIELYVADLAERQRAKGHETHVLTRTPDTAVDRWVLHTGGRPDEDRPEPEARLVRGEEVLTPAAGYDVVHVHASVFSPLAWRATRLCAARRIPVVYTAHSLLTGFVWAYAPAAWAMRAPRMPVVWSAVSEVAARSLARGLTLSAGAVRILPNAVDAARWQPGPVREPGAVLTFVAVMRLATRKRPRALLRAFEAARVGSAARLVVVGDGPRAGACRRWCDGHRDLDVVLAGQQTRQQIRATLAGSDVFLAAATRESFGIAALEARESGLPVVGRRGTGLVDFVDDEGNGLLVGSDAAMAGAIRRLATDRDLLTRLTETARAKPSGYDWESATARTDEAYAAARDLVRRAAPAGRRRAPR